MVPLQLYWNAHDFRVWERGGENKRLKLLEAISMYVIVTYVSVIISWHWQTIMLKGKMFLIFLCALQSSQNLWSQCWPLTLTQDCDRLHAVHCFQIWVMVLIMHHIICKMKLTGHVLQVHFLARHFLKKTRSPSAWQKNLADMWYCDRDSVRLKLNNLSLCYNKSNN